jgi:hypothetical protein
MALPFQFFHAGPCFVEYDDDELGIAEDRVEIQIQPFFEDIRTDSAGGLAGPFHDRQFLGSTAQITCTLTTFDEESMRQLQTYKIPSNHVGLGFQLDVGEFIYQDGHFGVLIIRGTEQTLQFEHAHLAMAVASNQSVRHKRWQVGWIARVDQFCPDSKLMEYTGAASCVDSAH